ncbi:MAG: endonuclease domain-containing protein, partial [Candidatus Competibacteraceae bacterium]|nr:endonuclease domain-containing protein [Candidatus Competibacteraceae bacterium]
MARIYNRPTEKPKRRQLRSNTTTPEQRLWLHLRNRQLAGLKFRRQYGIGRYVLDFYCPHLRLGIELDGDSHYQSGGPAHDRQRQLYIESLGIELLRFGNRDVMENMDGVLRVIAARCGELERER